MKSGANPATGIYDLRFAIYDSTNLPGTLIAGPLTNSAISVTNGLFTVALDFGNVFPGADRWLEIAVRSNGVAAFTTLSPRQQLTATTYAVTAGNVTGPINGGSIISGTITGNQLAPGAVGSNQLAPGAAAANLNAGGQSCVGSDGLVLSATENNTALLNAGYIKIGPTATGDVWQQRGNGTTLAARFLHTAVCARPGRVFG